MTGWVEGKSRGRATLLLVMSFWELRALERNSGFSSSMACELSPDTQGRVSAGQRAGQLGLRDIGMMASLASLTCGQQIRLKWSRAE